MGFHDQCLQSALGLGELDQRQHTGKGVLVRGQLVQPVMAQLLKGAYHWCHHLPLRRTHAGEVVSRPWNNFHVQVEFNAVKIQYLGWRNSSAVKSTYCFCGGLEFHSQYLWWFATIQNSSSRGSHDFSFLISESTRNTERQNTHVNKQIKPLSFKLWFHLQYNEIQYDVIVNVWISTRQCMAQRSLLASGILCALHV